MSDDLIIWAPGITLESIEKMVILKAFRFYRGNKTQTSQALGIAIRTLDNKLEKYEADGKEQKRKEDELSARDADFLARQRGPTRSINDSAEERKAQRDALLPRAEAGIYMESIAQASKERGVPVFVGEKVQAVPSSATAQGSAGKPRR